MFDVRQVLLFGLLAGILAAVALRVWPWSRQRRRFVVGGICTSVGFIVWNLVLNVTSATGFNVDAPVVFLSLADVGSGVLGFVVNALVLGLVTERAEPAGRVVGAAAIAGLVAMGLDLFVL
jgi:hypothetical protein